MSRKTWLQDHWNHRDCRVGWFDSVFFKMSSTFFDVSGPPPEDAANAAVAVISNARTPRLETHTFIS